MADATYPRWPYRINWRDPITRGLVMCAVNDHGSVLARDLVTGLVASLGGDDDFPVIETSRLGGRCVGQEAGSMFRGYLSMPSTFGLGTAGVTLVAWGSISSVLGDSSGPFIKVGDASTGYGIGVGNGTWDTRGNNIIALFEGVRWIDPSVAVPDTDTMHLFGMSITDIGGGDVMTEFYFDGELVQSDSGAAPIQPANETGCVGYNSLSRQIWGRGQHFRIWNRVLRSAEHWRLYDPATRWGMYWQPARERFQFEEEAAVGGGFQAAWASGSNVIIQPGL